MDVASGFLSYLLTPKYLIKQLFNIIPTKKGGDNKFLLKNQQQTRFLWVD